jgi:pimeloyl-ACP methyl ester carboxylesterase
VGGLVELGARDRALRASDYRLRAIANPLQGLASDTAYLSSYLATIDGPIVLVGHSYGGALITNVDTSAFDIRALVYVAGFITVKGETVGQLAGQSSPPLPLVSVDVPGGAEVAINAVAFPEAFAGDLDEDTAAGLAIVQRPVTSRPSRKPPSTRRSARSPPGRSSPGRTGRSALTCSGSWPAAPRRTSPSSTPHMRS